MRRVVFTVLLSILLLSLLSLQLNFRVVSADSYYFNFDIEVTPESPSTHDVVNVTVSFETNYIYAIPANFSSLSKNEYNFSVTIEVYPIHGPLPVTGYEEETYNLENLTVGLYHFNVDVQVWSAPPDELVRILLESASYSQSFTIAALVTITVPDDYPTIQEAINGASDGDTVFVRNGTYYENVVVNKSVVLMGEDREGTIVDGNGSDVFQLKTNNITVTQFTIQHGLRGISANIDSWNSTIYNNNIVNNSYGILMEGWYSCIYENIIGGNAISGLWIEGFYTRILNNRIVWNGYYFPYPGGSGIELYITDWNFIFRNTIADNNCGVSFSSAISFTCHNNTIHHNNFINNTGHIDIGNSANTTFDNGCEGNYWSDYEAKYPNASYDMFGIWNTSYVIDGANQDNYPLRNLFWNPADTDHDLKVDIFDVVKCAACYCMDWEEHFCHVDINEPYGIVDIYDIVLIATNYGEEYTP